jgi:hypothetical protein
MEDEIDGRAENSLYSGVCMRKIFARMGKKRGDHHYVQPWTLWDGKSTKIQDVLNDVIANSS